MHSDQTFTRTQRQGSTLARNFLICATTLTLGVMVLPSLVTAAPVPASSIAQVPTSAPTSAPRENRLNLTDTHKQQIKAIRQSERSQIAGILNPQQRTQYEQALQANQKKRGLLRSLNLTDTQKEQMRTIKQASKQQIQSLLTPEQLQLMQQRKPRPQAQ